MRIIGILFTLGGWLLAIAGVFMTASDVGRVIFACAGIAITLIGSLGFINKYYLSQAVWKK